MVYKGSEALWKAGTRSGMTALVFVRVALEFQAYHMD